MDTAGASGSKHCCSCPHPSAHLCCYILRVVAREGCGDTPLRLNNLSAQLIQELSVVRHNDHGHLLLLQVLLQPLDGVKVQVVGGLVKEQNVGLLIGWEGIAENRTERLQAGGWVPRGGAAAAGARLVNTLSRSAVQHPHDAPSACPSQPALQPLTCSNILPKHMRICQPPLNDATSLSLSSGLKPSSGIIWSIFLSSRAISRSTA